MGNNDRNSKQPEFNAAYIDQLLAGTPVKTAPEPPVPDTPAAPEQETPAVKVKKRLPKKLSAVLIIVAAIAFLCLILLLCMPDPYADITDEQWIGMCQDAYDSLYQKEQLHFTRNLVAKTKSETTATAIEVWFSGADYYQQETRQDGAQRAFLGKDGIQYHNYLKELLPSGWHENYKNPVFTRGSRVWADTEYALDRIDRKGRDMEVIFSKDIGLETLGTQRRFHYLIFRFGRDLKLKAIVWDNVLYRGKEPDPDNVNTFTTNEYIFHDTSTETIERAIAAPLESMAAYEQESQEWHKVAAAVFDELCSRTVMHYTYNEVHNKDNNRSYTIQAEGWICGTDNLVFTKRESGKTLKTTVVNKGTNSYSNRIEDGKDSGWSVRQREPSMHYLYQWKWNPDSYFFYKAEADRTGTSISFYKSHYSPGSDSISHGITTITFHLDKDTNLKGITVSDIRDGEDYWAPNLLNAAPQTVTEYQFHDVTEAQAGKEIDKYCKKAISGK